jgi:DUF917 family protein
VRTSIAAEDIEPFVLGLTIMGTGGGGSPAFGRAILGNDLRQGRELAVISPDDIADDAQVVSGGIMGSTEIIDRLGFDEIVCRWETDFVLATATRAMERVVRRRIDYIVPFEVGGLNTPVILSLAARMGIGAVDGDALGRSAPQTQMTSFIGHGISLTPMPLVDSDGNEIVVQRACDPTLPDKLGRHLLSNSSGMGANNHYPMSGRDLKRVVVPGSVSNALRLGRKVVAAGMEGRDCIQAVVDHLEGRHVFTGEVTELVASAREGFYATTARLQGLESSQARQAELTIQNETMLLHLDGKVAAIFPDLVCMLDPVSGRGVLSTELQPGVQVALVTTACHPRLREAATSDHGRPSFSPANFGFPELEYRPVEDLLPALGLW